MFIREATEADAQQGSSLLKRSIIELCGRDHKWEPAHIGRWIANKTPENWLCWVNSASEDLYVAERSGILLGIGMLSHASEIVLNYVCPDHRFHGVSKAMLKHMEDRAKELGARSCFVETTITAATFHRSAGYTPVPGFDAVRKMQKCLC
ncbi:GNAT family N-acetyltransferase [Rhizobium multihospitium]|uniref:GNAT family N-acetyltransferase n=1 Tax=Rhizobium multihospitium TaxID=410764 RepID=UPI000B80E80A